MTVLHFPTVSCGNSAYKIFASSLEYKRWEIILFDYTVSTIHNVYLLHYNLHVILKLQGPE